MGTAKGQTNSTNGADYMIDGLHIIESDYPGDAAYAWVVGAETAYIVGNTL